MQQHTSMNHKTAGVITSRSLWVLMETLTWEMMLCIQHQRTLSHSGSSRDARKEVVGTLTWKMILLTQHQIHAVYHLLSHLGHTSLVMQWTAPLIDWISDTCPQGCTDLQWTVVGLAFFKGLAVCLTAFAWLFGVLALLLSWPALAREWQPLWHIL